METSQNFARHQDQLSYPIDRKARILKGILVIILVVLGYFRLEAQIPPISGNKFIPGDYSTLTAAFMTLQSAGISGPVIIELQSGYTGNNETFPIVIGAIPGSGVNTITVRPSASASGLVINGSHTGSIIDLIAATNIIIDGRPGGLGSSRELMIRNSLGRAIRFAAGSQNNQLRYCELQGVNGPPIDVFGVDGVVYFDGYSNSSVGNSSNTVSDCLISDNGSGELYGAIYSSPNEAFPNAQNTLANNMVANFNGFGINISPNNGGEWAITGNSFYNTLDQPTFSTQTGIFFAPGEASSGNVISGNYIGGQSATTAGAKWNSNAPDFIGIYLSVGNSSPTSLHNNVIGNLTFTNPQLTNFIGISIASGITANNGNVIGSINNLNSITFAGSANVTGISVGSESPVSVTGDYVSNIFINGVDAEISGIRYTGGGDATISNNSIFNISAKTTTGINFTGMYIGGVGNTTSNLHNNLVSAIALSTDGAVDGAGILIDRGIGSSITANSGNVVGSISKAGSITATGADVSFSGIVIRSSSFVSVTNDNVGNIYGSGSSSSVVQGIVSYQNNKALIAGNTVHDLTGSEVKSILIKPGSGNPENIVTNNTITGLNLGVGLEIDVVAGVSLKLTARDNTISNFATGLSLSKQGSAQLETSIHNNLIYDNDLGINNETGSPIDFTCNWWGDATGPSGIGSGTGDAVSANVIYDPWATLSEFISVSAGSDQVIYRGYGPQSVTLRASAVACSGIQYLWTSGATSEMIEVSPMETTTYSVTVMDAAGHTASDAVTVIIEDIRCDSNGKVSVCHKGQTICINTSAVITHLDHGDMLGACETIAAMSASDEFDRATLRDFVVYPNPARDKIMITSRTVREKPAVWIMDVTGRVWNKKDQLSNEDESHWLVNIGDLPSGLYRIVLMTQYRTSSATILKE